MKIVRDLRIGLFDVLVGINLLREGLDIPEVSLVAVLDADKEGFLRSETSLIQTVGRAARNVEGKVIMYADKVTDSMKRAINETNRRRKLQSEFNKENKIIPKTIKKGIREIIEASKISEHDAVYLSNREIDLNNTNNIDDIIIRLTNEMKEAAKSLQFEKAAMLRDKIEELKLVKLNSN
jgi:excinuclease ABC subunit B